MFKKLRMAIERVALYRFVFVFIALSYSSAAMAQGPTVSQKNLIWYSEECTEKHSGTTVQSSTRIEVYNNHSINLVIEEQIISFSISSVVGEWEDETQDGTLEYALLYDNTMNGNMRIIKLGGNIVLSVDMTLDNPDGIHYDFYVDRVVVVNEG